MFILPIKCYVFSNVCIINNTLTVLYIIIILIALFCNGISLNKTYQPSWVPEPASLVSVNRHASH